MSVEPDNVITGYCDQGRTFTRAMFDLTTAKGRYVGTPQPAIIPDEIVGRICYPSTL